MFSREHGSFCWSMKWLSLCTVLLFFIVWENRELTEQGTVNPNWGVVKGAWKKLSRKTQCLHWTFEHQKVWVVNWKNVEIEWKVSYATANNSKYQQTFLLTLKLVRAEMHCQLISYIHTFQSLLIEDQEYLVTQGRLGHRSNMLWQICVYGYCLVCVLKCSRTSIR